MAKLNQHPEKALLPLIGVSLLLLLGLVVMYFAQSQSTELRSKAAQFKGSCASEEKPRCREGQRAVCTTTKENIKAMKDMSQEEKKTFMEGIANSFKWECEKTTGNNSGSGASNAVSGSNDPGGSALRTGCTCDGFGNRYCYDGDKPTYYPNSPECQ